MRGRERTIDGKRYVEVVKGWEEVTRVRMGWAEARRLLVDGAKIVHESWPDLIWLVWSRKHGEVRLRAAEGGKARTRILGYTPPVEDGWMLAAEDGLWRGLR